MICAGWTVAVLERECCFLHGPEQQNILPPQDRSCQDGHRPCCGEPIFFSRGFPGAWTSQASHLQCMHCFNHGNAHRVVDHSVNTATKSKALKGGQCGLMPSFLLSLSARWQSTFVFLPALHNPCSSRTDHSSAVFRLTLCSL